MLLLGVAIDDDIANQAQHTFLCLQEVAHSLLEVFRSTGDSKRLYVETKTTIWSDECGELA